MASFIAVLFVATAPSAQAATTLPTKMNFQGRITNSAGNILANGTYNMRFKIYNALTSGTLQWSEDRLVSGGPAQYVTVTNGQFNVQLGSVSSLPASVFASDSLYFEVELPTPASATTSSPVWTEGPMSPRNQLATSAYAYNSETLDGIDGAAFALIGTGNAFTAANTFSGTSGFTNTIDVNVGSAAALRVRNGATNLFNVDTTNSIVSVGVSDTTGAVLVLDTKTGAGDPTGVEGAMYYNSNAGKFRCYQAGAWTDCIGAGGSSTLQDAYNSSSSPAVITTTAAKGVEINAGAAPTTDIFKVSNTGFGTTTANADAAQIDYVGGAAAVEGAGARINLTPGTTTGGTWSGMRVVAGATGAASGVTEYGIKVEGPTSPGTGTETGMYIGTGWDTGLDVQSGGLNLAGYTTGGTPDDPPTPAADNLRVYAKKIAGRMMLKWKAPSGVDTSLQTNLGFNTVMLWTPATGTTAVGTGFGNTWPAATGTVTHPTVTNTNLSNSVKAMQLANVATTLNQTLGLTASTATYQNFWRGNAAGLGGFFMQTRFKTALVPAATHRTFVGLTSMTTGAVVGDTVTGDTAGLSHITTDSATTMAFMTRDNTTTNRATFTVPTIASGNIYDFTMFSPPNGSSIFYRLVDLTTGTVLVDSSTATNIPRNTIFMGPQVQMSNGAANILANTTAIGINKIYLETDN